MDSLSGIYSSSIINTNTTINTETYLPEEWLLDISCLSSIGFREGHLRKIYEASKQNSQITPNRVRESMYALAHDLKDEQTAKNLKSKYSKAGLPNVFVGTMKRGDDWMSTRNPEKFKLPEEEALEKRISALASQKERVESMYAELFKLEYSDWLNNQSEESLLEFVSEKDFLNTPKKIKKTIMIRHAKTLTEDYFKAEIWPKLKEKIRVGSEDNVV